MALTSKQTIRLRFLQKKCLTPSTGAYKKNARPADLEELARLIAKADGKDVRAKAPRVVEWKADAVETPISVVPETVRPFVEQGYEYIGQAYNGILYLMDDKAVYRLDKEQGKDVLYRLSDRKNWTDAAIAKLVGDTPPGGIYGD